jgi:hypothetical protein
VADEKKVKVDLPSIESTTQRCPGCNKNIDLLSPHLTMMLKPERAVVINQPLSEYEAIVSGEERTAEEILAAADVDEEEESVNYLGWRSGEGTHVKFHDHGCLFDWADKHQEDKVKIKFFRPEGDHYENVGRSSS